MKEIAIKLIQHLIDFVAAKLLKLADDKMIRILINIDNSLADKCLIDIQLFKDDKS